MATAETDVGPHCRICGSLRVRRSSPHGPIEKWMRRRTSFHFIVCGECGRRTWLWWPAGNRHQEQEHRTPGRSVETRDTRRRSREHRSKLFIVIVAVALGLAAGVFVERCGRILPVPAERR
jgi:hypothetical protein